MSLHNPRTLYLPFLWLITNQCCIQSYWTSLIRTEVVGFFFFFLKKFHHWCVFSPFTNPWCSCWFKGKQPHMSLLSLFHSSEKLDKIGNDFAPVELEKWVGQSLPNDSWSEDLYNNFLWLCPISQLVLLDLVQCMYSTTCLNVYLLLSYEMIHKDHLRSASDIILVPSLVVSFHNP